METSSTRQGSVAFAPASLILDGRFRIDGLIPEGTNSHTFEPAPSDAQTLAKADLIIVNGLHLEQPTLDMAAVSKSASAEIKELGENTVAAQDWLFDFSFPESAGDPERKGEGHVRLPNFPPVR